MIITTTPIVEGKEIKEYLGLVSGTDIYLVGGLLGGGLASQEKLYSAALNNACNKMTAKALSLDADAIVGVSVNVSSPGTTAHIIVSVVGTAVKILDVDGIPEI